MTSKFVATLQKHVDTRFPLTHEERLHRLSARVLVALQACALDPNRTVPFCAEVNMELSHQGIAEDLLLSLREMHPELSLDIQTSSYSQPTLVLLCRADLEPESISI